MFIGWIRKKSFSNDLEAFAKNVIIDKSLIVKTFERDQSLCFGAYNENSLVAFISAYELNSQILINNFYYLPQTEDDIKKRVVKLLLNNLSNSTKTILFMLRKDETHIINSFGFEEYAKFKKAIYRGSNIPFNFTNAMAKSISNENFMPLIINMNKRALSEDKTEYIKEALLKESSLVLSNTVGYQHSYSLNKTIVKISPWIMEDAAFSDAEKMLRGVIYHRGLKKLFAFIPSEVKEITDLYASYKFDLSDEYVLVYKNQKPSINLEMLYAF